MPDGSSLNVDFPNSLSILCLKSRILSIFPSLPPTFQLMHSGKILKEDRTLESYSIQPNSTLTLIIKPSLIQVIIRKFGGNCYTIDIERDFPISKVKQRIRQKTGIPEVYQKLIFRNKTIEDDDSIVSNLDIDDKSVINVMLSDKIEVTITWKQQQKDLTLLLNKKDQIELVKAKVCKAFLVDVDQQVLIWEGKKLENLRRLDEYCVGNGSVLNLVVHDTIQVFVEVTREQVITLDVLLLMTLEELKRLIEERLGVRVENLALSGVVLNEDEKSLFEYGVKKFSLIKNVLASEVLSESRLNTVSQKSLVTPFNVVKDNSDSILSEP